MEFAPELSRGARHIDGLRTDPREPETGNADVGMIKNRYHNENK